MYALFSRVPQTLKEVQKVMMDCMCEAGRDVLNDPEKVKDPVSFITAILHLKHKYDRFVKESFKESKDFQLALKQAFESFLNKDTRTAQYLSLYVDDQFRKGLKGMSSDADVDAALEQVVTVFRFLQDKDVFENFYKQHLARRLLTGRSVSDEAEKSMISKLKSECGHQYTSKLEGMFQDMKQSEEIMKQYKSSFASSSSMARAARPAG
ncbi:CUL3A, partial [Symbiodinium sp. KB8]